MNIASPATNSGSEADVIDLKGAVSTIWRGKYFVALAVVIFTLLGKYYIGFIAVPMYTSTSVVILDQRETDVTNLGNVLGDLGGDTVTLNSEVEVIKSRSLLERVVADLDLTSDAEFNPDLKAASNIDEILTRIRETLGFKDRDVTDGRKEIIVAVNNLLDKIDVQVLPGTFVIRIAVQTNDGAKSALISQTIAEIYVQSQIETKLKATEDASTWLSTRVSELQLEVERTQTEVKAFKATSELLSIEELAVREIQLKELRERLEETRSAMRESVLLLDALEKAEDPDLIVQLSGDSMLRTLHSQFDTNPEAKLAFYERINTLTPRVKNKITQADTEITTLSAGASAMAAQVARQNEELIKLQQLQRTAESNRVLYEHFLNRLKETSAQQGLHNSDSRVLSRAEIPFGPSSPKGNLVTALCVVLGAFFGVAFVLLKEKGTSVYRTSEELEDDTGMTSLGQVPILPFTERAKVLTYLDENRTSPAAEAVRNLRTSIFLSATTPPKVICVSSSMPGEGKSTLSLALAQNVAQMGKKVLVIEGDMRRRIFSSFSETTSPHGFASVASGSVDLKDAVKYNPEVGADILHAEESKINPADIFSSPGFGNLLIRIREDYDFIVIDTPPILVVPDARILAKQVDSMLVVVKWDSTTKEMVSETLRELRKVGIQRPSLVLNQINFKKMQGYGYGGQYGNYKNYNNYYNT